MNPGAQRGQIPGDGNHLRFLDASLTQRIDDALRRVGDFGEVRLIVVKGAIRFIQIVTSESAPPGVGERKSPA